MIEDIAAARDALYATRRRGAVLELLRLRGDDRLDTSAVPLPFERSVAIAHADPRFDGAVLSLGGWTRVAKPYLLAGSGAPQRLMLVRDGAFDAPSDIEAREVLVRSHDGVLVPLSTLSRKGPKRHGGNPAILYGYGAYGNTQDPFFGPRIYAWLERGGIFAVANPRGSGALARTGTGPESRQASRTVRRAPDRDRRGRPGRDRTGGSVGAAQPPRARVPRAV